MLGFLSTGTVRFSGDKDELTDDEITSCPTATISVLLLDGDDPKKIHSEVRDLVIKQLLGGVIAEAVGEPKRLTTASPHILTDLAARVPVEGLRADLDRSLKSAPFESWAQDAPVWLAFLIDVLRGSRHEGKGLGQGSRLCQPFVLALCLLRVGFFVHGREQDNEFVFLSYYSRDAVEEHPFRRSL